MRLLYTLAIVVVLNACGGNTTYATAAPVDAIDVTDLGDSE